jgi:hypothetical protein
MNSQKQSALRIAQRGQRPRLVPHAPQPFRMFAVVIVEPRERFRIHHLGRLQARAAKLSDDLAKRKARVARHRRLQHGRVDLQRTDE